MAARTSWTGALVLLGLWQAAAFAQSPQEKQRTDILKGLGLEKKPPAPPAPPPAEVEPAAVEDKELPTPADAGRSKAARPSGPAAPSFSRAIHPLLTATCKPCHAPGAPAGASRLLLSGDAAADYRGVARLVDVKNPDASALLTKAAGTVMHGGAAPWPPSSPPYQRTLAWIRGGARLDAVAAAPVEPPKPLAATPAKRPAPGGEATSSAAAAPAEPPPPEPPAGAPEPTAVAAKPAVPTFANDVHPILVSACAGCHRPGGPAAMTRFLLSSDAAGDEAAVRAFVDVAAPEQSPLLVKAAGQMHAGGAPLPAGDARTSLILAWAKSLAPPPSAAPETSAAAPPPAAPAPAPAPAAHSAAHGAPAGFGLPFGFMLNGRLSLDYERRQFTGSPFDDGSVNALRSYHHFLFLSRDLANEPCGLSLEVLTLQFWEVHCRVPLPPSVRLAIAGGKIVVPFGADPLFHQNYGGLGGFDQPVLPVIWAVEGAAAHLVVERRALALTDDLFVVRGYALPHADSIINLQSGFSSDDAVKLGVGNRVGVSWRFVSAWYSAYFNPLGFGRHLFMQALDLTVWRPRGVPVLQHFSLGAGLLRADVSGGGAGVGGAGLDYYDFADYLQVRYHPTDWLYLQYRTGLRTFDNRRGLVLDKSRRTSADASTHNFGIVSRCGGLTAGLYYFINLEKVDEVANDLFRLSVTYDF